VVCTWNLHSFNAWQAHLRARAAGCPTLVFEEAYTRRLCAEPHFAVAIDGHNGAGRWFPGGAERWHRLGIAVKPWRPSFAPLRPLGGVSTLRSCRAAATGDRSEGRPDRRHVLVCAARGMGCPAMREPRGWVEEVCRRLARLTTRPIKLRRHPGKGYLLRPLECDLEDAWAVVVWASNSATHALLAGIPVFHEAPHIITAGAAEQGIARIERPSCPERLPVFRRLAWAQWSLEEIRRGDPIRELVGGYLLRRAGQAQEREAVPDLRRGRGR